MDNPKTLEITSRIGCRNMCKYCPQTLLVSQYRKHSKNLVMSFSTLKKCLSTVPKDVRIDFSGMSEPWLNKDCTRMLLYAYRHGFKKIAVFTTCIGMTVEDVHKLKSIPYVTFYVHLADALGNTKIVVSNNYLKVLTEIKKNKIHNIKFMSMGKLHPKLKPLFGDSLENLPMYSRAGNLQSSPVIYKSGPITCCWYERLQHNILMPNGDILLCCADYGMKHVLGNLLFESYKDLFKGKEFDNILQLLKDEKKGDIICRHCEYATEDLESSKNMIYTHFPFLRKIKSIFKSVFLKLQ